MNSFSADEPTPVTHYVVLQQPQRRWVLRIVLVMLALSACFNFILLAATASYLPTGDPPHEKFHSGDALSSDKIARLEVNFTIMPPYTNRLLDAIKKAREDNAVKGVLLTINSPGGLVSDSHQIYHALRRLAETKPIYVAMKGIAASGGYYIAMGAGAEAPIYAEPTTWTGSIGVIVPRYNAAELAEKIGVTPDSLATGPLKDTLNPLKELSPEERDVWNVILQESLDQFLQVIDEGRGKLNRGQIEALATGQVYTATQALRNGLVDVIDYEEAALAALQEKLGLSKVRVIQYEQPKTVADILLGVSPPRAAAPDPLTALLQSTTPRAMYFFGWTPGIALARE